MRPDRELACQEVVELVTAYLEDALDPSDRQRFEEHLGLCDGCANYLEQMRTTIRLTGRVEAEVAPELEAQLLEAFRNWRTG
jgi:anti-sigma factor RsiW